MRFARRAALAFLVLVPLAYVAAARAEDSAKPAAIAPRTVVLVRHAEKDAQGNPKNPSLSPAGVERAGRLAKLFAHLAPTRVLASELARTQETAKPLAKAAAVAIDILPAGKPEAWAAEIEKSAPGAVVVAVGHSNTVPAIAARLGIDVGRLVDGAGGKQIDEAEFGRVFVITLPPAGSAVAPSCVELAY